MFAFWVGILTKSAKFGLLSIVQSIYDERKSGKENMTVSDFLVGEVWLLVVMIVAVPICFAIAFCVRVETVGSKNANVPIYNPSGIVRVHAFRRWLRVLAVIAGLIALLASVFMALNFSWTSLPQIGDDDSIIGGRYRIITIGEVREDGGRVMVFEPITISGNATGKHRVVILYRPIILEGSHSSEVLVRPEWRNGEKVLLFKFFKPIVPQAPPLKMGQMLAQISLHSRE